MLVLYEENAADKAGYWIAGTAYRVDAKGKEMQISLPGGINSSPPSAAYMLQWIR